MLEVARETTGLPEKQLRKLLDPVALTQGGIRRGGRRRLITSRWGAEQAPVHSKYPPATTRESFEPHG